MDSISPAALRKVTRELYALKSDPPEGIRPILNETVMTDIQAWIQGPGFFLTKIFHPNVSKQGDVCVSTLKKDWKKDLGLRHILLVVKCLLIAPNPESALNEEAGRQLLEHYDDYAKHARLMTGIHAQSAGQDVFAARTVSNSGSSSNSAITATSTVAAKDTTLDPSRVESHPQQEQFTSASNSSKAAAALSSSRLGSSRLSISLDSSTAGSFSRIPTVTTSTTATEDQSQPSPVEDVSSDATASALSAATARTTSFLYDSATASTLALKRKHPSDEKIMDHHAQCSSAAASHTKHSTATTAAVAAAAGLYARQTLQGLPTHPNQAATKSSHPLKQLLGHTRLEPLKDRVTDNTTKASIGAMAPKSSKGLMESRKRTLRRL
ncbi:hypothetical protein BGZ99_008511 [Dissophora globulifera]|uniref:UBC core domain-containing protein n=1 Tax=Dissophora globulifera TaxID=979702 RepID=A0A9P6R830_9FUNG|nr:hypothetical protein BGZ99_008511 [Dissophora globulifera]